MGQICKPTMVANLIRLFDRGRICPCEFWRAVELEVTPGELTDVFCALSASEQGLLRNLFHERPLSHRATESRAFRRQLRKWVVGSQAPIPPAENRSAFILLRQ